MLVGVAISTILCNVLPSMMSCNSLPILDSTAKENVGVTGTVFVMAVLQKKTVAKNMQKCQRLEYCMSVCLEVLVRCTGMYVFLRTLF